jgi:Protein of unknown function (DUF2671)
MPEVNNTKAVDESASPFDNIRYICNSTNLITEALQKGFDVAQLPNGDIIITEIKTVNVQYSWNNARQQFVKTNNQLF